MIKKVKETVLPDQKFTPRSLIKSLHTEFSFTLDPSGHPLAPATRMIPKYCDGTICDGLSISWARERVFNNPPWSDIPRWVEKAYNEIRSDCSLIVQLLPATRTEQPWWQNFIEPYRDLDFRLIRTPNGIRRDKSAYRGFVVRVRFVAARPRYGNPSDPEGDHVGSPNFTSVIIIWTNRGYHGDF